MCEHMLPKEWIVHTLKCFVLGRFARQIDSCRRVSSRIFL